LQTHCSDKKHDVDTQSCYDPCLLFLQDFFCVAWQGADWDGKALADNSTGWKPCPSELRYASKDVSSSCLCSDKA
jgi:hypothetical protein